MTLKKSEDRWFWAWLVQMTVAKAALENPKAMVEVWKNLVILKARSAAHALSKASRIGSGGKGDCEGTLRLYGKPAITKFLGVLDIGLVTEDLGDGSEITWELKRCR